MHRILVAILLIAAAPTFAQDPEPYDVGWFADAQGTQRWLTVTPNVPYQVHAVLFDAPEEIQGYEFAITGIPVGTFRLEAEFFGPSPGGAEEYNYVVGMGGCAQPEAREGLVTLTLLSVVRPPECTRLFMTESFPTSSTNGRPVVVTCDDRIQELRLFGQPDANAFPGQLVLNPPLPPPLLGGDEPDGCYPISGSTHTFSAIKARF